jgi:hypothetical protein
MEQPKTPNFRRLAFFMALFLIFTLALLFWARDIIQEAVVLPLSYIFWGLGVLVDFTPQVFFWILLMFLASWIAYSTLARRRRLEQAYVHTIIDPADGQTRGRVAFWDTRVEFLTPGQSEYFSRSFHSALGKLLLEMLAYRYRLTSKQVDDGLRDGTIDLPAEVRAYALDSIHPGEFHRMNFFIDLWDQILERLRGVFFKLRDLFWTITGSTNRNSTNRNFTSAPGLQQNGYLGSQAFKIDASALTDGRIRRVIEFMEGELEVLHDDTGR